MAETVAVPTFVALFFLSWTGDVYCLFRLAFFSHLSLLNQCVELSAMYEQLSVGR